MPNHNIFIEELGLKRPEGAFRAAFCCGSFTTDTDYQEMLSHLHPQEWIDYYSFKYEKRKKSYLMGHFVAKQALAVLTEDQILTNILIQPGIFNQPVVVNQPNIQVSITHGDDFGAAVAFPEAHPMGIDLEKIETGENEALERYISDCERRQIDSLPLSYHSGLYLIWTAKEALSKVLKTGLTTPFEVFEIEKIESNANYIISYYQNFSQYKAISFVIGHYMFSIAYPLKTELVFDLQSMKNQFCLAPAE